MILVISEKPSLAASLVAVLGASKRENGYFSGNGYSFHTKRQGYHVLSFLLWNIANEGGKPVTKQSD
jgi:hypothetical protein